MRTLLLIGIIAFSFGCTSRKSESSQIRIDLSQLTKNNVSASSISQVALVVVNITGPNMTPIFIERNCLQSTDENYCKKIQTPSFPTGSRLVQVMALGIDTDSVTNILYGDLIKSFAGGDEEVSVSLDVAGKFNESADWSGRYVPTASHTRLAGKYLTGQVDVRFFPGDNKPSMKVNEFQIYGGWFHAFLVDSLTFKYEFSGWDQHANVRYENVEIFDDLHGGEGLTSNSPSLAPANSSDSSKFVLSPLSPMFREQEGSFAETDLHGPIVFGFYGQNTDNRRVCSYEIAPESPFSYDASPVTGTSKTVNAAQICNSITAGVCSDFADYPADFSTQGAFPDCSGGATAEDWPIDVRRLDQREGLTGFVGPFSRDITSAQYDLFYQVSLGVLGWHIDPNAAVSEVAVFKRIGVGGFDLDEIEVSDGNFDCNELIKDDLGFTEDTDGSVPKGVDQYSLQLPEVAAGLELVFCPKDPEGNFYGIAAKFEPQIPDRSLRIGVVRTDGVTLAGPASNHMHEFPPVDAGGGSAEIFFVVENQNSEDINVDFHFNANFQDAGFTFPGGLPAGGSYTGVTSTIPDLSLHTACSTPSHLLTANGSCVLRVLFTPSGILSSNMQLPATFYDAISIGGPGVLTTEYYNSSVEIIAPVPYEYFGNAVAVSPQDLNFYSKAGQESIFYLKIRAGGSSLFWNNIVTSNAQFLTNAGGPEPNTCPVAATGGSQITTGNHCYLRVSFLGDGANYTTESLDFVDFGEGAVSAGSNLINLYGENNFSVTDTGDNPLPQGLGGNLFFDMASNTTGSIRLKNNSASDLNIYDVAINSPFTILDATSCWNGFSKPDGTGSFTYDNGTTDCDISFSSTFSDEKFLFFSYFLTRPDEGTTFRSEHVRINKD